MGVDRVAQLGEAGRATREQLHEARAIRSGDPDRGCVDRRWLGPGYHARIDNTVV
jgi:hypothetical protein